MGKDDSRGKTPFDDQANRKGGYRQRGNGESTPLLER